MLVFGPLASVVVLILSLVILIHGICVGVWTNYMVALHVNLTEAREEKKCFCFHFPLLLESQVLLIGISLC